MSNLNNFEATLYVVMRRFGLSLKEGKIRRLNPGPSLESCWEGTVGICRQVRVNVELADTVRANCKYKLLTIDMPI